MLQFENSKIAFSQLSHQALKRRYLTYIWLPKKKWILKIFGLWIPVLTKLHFPFKPFIKNNILFTFCSGETVEDVINNCKTYPKELKFILNFSLERGKSEKKLERACSEMTKAIEKTKNNSSILGIAVKPSGITHFSILKKLHSNQTLTSREQNEWKKAQKRFFAISELAEKYNKIVWIDSEETWIQNPVDDIAWTLMKKFNTKKCVIYNTYQMYLKHRYRTLVQDAEKALNEGFKLGVKLVRGAYLEKERKFATKCGLESPINISKEETDSKFDHYAEYCLRDPNIFVFFGTHNENSTQKIVTYMGEKKIKKNTSKVIFGQLFGMSDNITYTLSENGYLSSKYLTYGKVKEVLPFLLRRAKENSSVGTQQKKELVLLRKEIQRRKLL